MEGKGSTIDPNINIIYGINSKLTITKSTRQSAHLYIQLQNVYFLDHVQFSETIQTTNKTNNIILFTTSYDS